MLDSANAYRQNSHEESRTILGELLDHQHFVTHTTKKNRVKLKNGLKSTHNLNRITVG